MVPKGKTGLCCDMYCFGPDKLLELDDLSIVKLTLDDCGRSGLLDPAKCFDHCIAASRELTLRKTGIIG